MGHVGGSPRKKEGLHPHAQYCITDNRLQLNVYDIKEKIIIIIIIDSNLNPWQLIRELYFYLYLNDKSKNKNILRK